MDGDRVRPEQAPSEPEAPAHALPVWLDRAPDAPWCPENLQHALPWLAEVDLRNVSSTLAPWREGWTLVGASRRGRLHAHRGEFREDAFRIVTGERYFVLVIADGAGSARLSRIGAEAACRAVDRHVRSACDSAASLPAEASGVPGWMATTLGDAVAAAIEGVDDLARASGIDPQEFRTTLVTAFWYAGLGQELLAVSQVGDGFVAARGIDGRLVRLGSGDVSEYSGEVSCFVPDEGAVARARAVTVVAGAGLSVLLLGTDGVEDPFYPIERHGELLCSQLAGGVAAPAPNFQRQDVHGPVLAPDGDRQLARWLGFERRGENDDRTLLVAWR